MSRAFIRGVSRWRYRLEKGNPHVIGLAALVIGLGLLVVLSALVLLAAGESDSFFDAAWWSFLQLSDPGYLGDADTGLRRALGIGLWGAGVLGVTAFLIAVVSSIVATNLERLREQGFDIAFERHTLIVGWNDKVFTLIEELLTGNPKMEIALLGPHDKDVGDLALEKHVFAPLASRSGIADPRRRVVYRAGSARVEVDLKRVCAERASQIILLAEQGERGLATDVAMLRNYLAIHRYRDQHRDQATASPVSTVMEITDDGFRAHAFLAADLDPRADAWLMGSIQRDELMKGLPYPEHPAPEVTLTLVNADQLVSRAIVQCAVQPTLSHVLEEILSFRGKEFFITEGAAPELAALAEEVSVNALPGHLSRALGGNMVCGVYEENEQGGGRAHFDPARIHAHLAEWPLIVLGESEAFRAQGAGSRLTLSGRPEPLELEPQPAAGTALAARSYRVLILGENRRLPVLMEQFAAHAAQYEELELHLTFVSTELDTQTVHELAKSVRHLKAEHHVVHTADYAKWSVLAEVLGESEAAEGRSFESVVLLAEDCGLDGNQVDARVILGVVMLRAFRADPSWAPRLAGTSVVAELLDPQNVDVIGTEDWIADVIISNQYVSRYMAQVSMDHRHEDIYRELLDYGSREIYERAVAGYLCEESEHGMTFLQAMTSAASRDEIAFGFTRKNGRRGPDTVLSPDPMIELRGDERLLVLALD